MRYVAVVLAFVAIRIGHTVNSHNLCNLERAFVAVRIEAAVNRRREALVVNTFVAVGVDSAVNCSFLVDDSGVLASPAVGVKSAVKGEGDSTRVDALVAVRVYRAVNVLMSPLALIAIWLLLAADHWQRLELVVDIFAVVAGRVQIAVVAWNRTLVDALVAVREDVTIRKSRLLAGG